MKRSKKGFTLIELLAVIVILAVIALIAVPIVLNVIEKARKGAAKTSTLNYIKAVETYIVASKLDRDALELKKGESYNCTKNTIIGEKNYLAINDLVEIKGYKPTGSNDQITIDENNQVSAGNLTINGYTVEIKDKEVSSIVKGAKIDVESISLNYSNQTMEKGSTFKLVPIFTPKDASDQRVTYTSSDTSVASVSDDGIVTAVNNGTAKITVTSKGDTSKKMECNITVITSATGVTVSPASKEINIGSTVQLVGRIEPGDVTTNALTWTSSNASIASVDENGLVTGISVGSATITAKTVNGKEATSTITVKAIEAESVTITNSASEIEVNDTLQLNATVSPNNTTDKSLLWTSSNTSVATVSNSGLVTGKTAGTTTITVKTSNNKTATKSITVKEAFDLMILKEDGTDIGSSYTIWNNASLQLKTNAPTGSNVIWTSSDESIATVSNSGLVTTKNGGSVRITATLNGKSDYVNIQHSTCFTGETLINTKEGFKQIKDIKVGDKVYSYNETTGEVELDDVVRKINLKTNVIYKIKVGFDIINTTENHEFYIRKSDEKEYRVILAKDIKLGDYMRTKEGKEVRITNIDVERKLQEVDVYNFTVGKNHNYFITNNKYLTHNAVLCGG